MNINVIQEIQEAEEKANLILEKSKEDSKKIFNDAVLKANDEYKKIISLANDEYDKILLTYKTEGEKISNDMENQFKVLEISNISNEKRKLAVNKIVEGIIGLCQ